MTPQKPAVLSLNPSFVPEELRAKDTWVGFRVVWKKDGQKERWTKEPVNLKTGGLGETDNPETWVPFEFAVENYQRCRCDGIGCCRTEDHIFIDLDGVLDDSGNLRPFPWARKILSAVAGRAYLERSIIGRGLHAICRGTLPAGRRQYDDPILEHTGFAFYGASRYFTFSGCTLPESGPISDLTAELAELHRELFPPTDRCNGSGPRPPNFSDSELLEKARKAANGAAFASLYAGQWEERYASQSEADLALCCHLAFWTGRDTSRIDVLFRQSGLYRDKWDRDDYKQRTIEQAIAQTHDVYEPRQPAHAEAAEEWPKPEPIQSELPPVEAFSEDLLPDSFRPLVTDIAERMQVPMDYPAVVMVLCLAGAVNRRAVIQPKATDTGWVVVPNLWGGIIAPPGFMKSPVIQATARPVNQIQTEWHREHEEAVRDYARAKEEYELRLTVWKGQYKSASKKRHAVPGRPEDEPEEPKLRRLVVNDATFEAMHQTMSENPAGILVIRDELTGWWSTLDKPGREGERAFCLQAWNGDTGHTIDRIGRGTIRVPHCCMSMLGGIQPGRLRSYLVDALKDGPTNDGLIQRFQLLVWPDTTPNWKYVDRAPDAERGQKVARVFRRLVELDLENPMRFRFSLDAQELFIEWLAELETKVRGNELHPALISHLSKYRSLMPSLALLFELADRAEGVFDVFVGAPQGKSKNVWVSLEHAQQAASWCEYLESHARRVYSCVVTPQQRAARELADKIKHRKIGIDGSFSCRDVYLKGWSGLDTPEVVKQAAEVLQDARWIRAVGGQSSDPLGRGRPSDRYDVNPGVLE